MSRTVPVRSTRTQEPSTRAAQLSDEPYRIDFGSHRGLTLSEAPVSWVRWAVMHEVYVSRPALRAALEQGGWLRPGGQAPDVRRGSNSDDVPSSSGGSGGKKGGQDSSGWKAFGGGGNVLGGKPADR